MFSYLKYRLRSQGKFRLHSPFVYDFYEEVLDKISRKDWRDELNNKLDSFLLSKKDVFKENERKWEMMIKEENSTLTIDCYHFGIIFKMKRKEKQHFILKF